MKQLIYQLLPRLWGNGRFSGLDKANLAWLKGLGMDYVWYTGVIRHATKCADKGCTPSHPQFVKGDAGSPYAITDWYDVNPYMADDPARRMEEFQDLVRRTHAAGLKVLIDFIPNHVARDNRNFGAGDDTSVHWAPENDFFYYPGQKLQLDVPCEGEPFYEYPAKASGNCFSPHPSVNDWYETVKLNYCDFHTGTWDKMRDIVLFWAAKGVDGFRCDMVELVPPAFMQWLIAEVKKQYPQLLFVAEVYQKDTYRKYLQEVGFDLLYDKSGLYDTLRAILCDGASARGITWNWQFLGDLQPRMLNFLENHDEQRLASVFFCGSAQAAFPALAVSLLFNDAPFLLYMGQEIGERGMDNEPFSGLNGRTTIFDWWTVESLQRLQKEIHTGKGLLPQEKAILERYRALLALSRRPAFASGSCHDLGYLQDSGFNPDQHFAFLRSHGSETWLVVANFGPACTLNIHLPDNTTVTVTVPQQEYYIQKL